MWYNVTMEWKEDKDKSYHVRFYYLDGFKKLLEFFLKYHKDDRINWIKIFNETVKV